MPAFCFSRLVFRSLLVFGVTAAAFFTAPPADAAPARIIILRHGEKQDAYRLCSVGNERARALAAQYLGKGAANSLFASGEGPAAFFAVTLHTMELAAPAAATWAQPVVMYTALPSASAGPRGKVRKAPAPGAPSASASPPAQPKPKRAVSDSAKAERKMDFTRLVTSRTQQAVDDVLSDPRWSGKTVVMVWEHDHIADAELEAANPGAAVTLRQLLKLGTLPEVPASWPFATYDYFWIVDFDADGKPVRFTLKRQVFEGAFSGLPSNEWGAPNGLTAASRCVL
ncbi:histidine phosphatase family protein [Xanthobacter sp. DSM 24535]|uniref:histidine phosphatase family protein n=1 Tax=Roseixanthobacter psychrophilus TaxID=3119917 RepID=UPI003728C8FA